MDMTSDIQSLDAVRRRLTVTVAAAEVDREFARALGTVQKKAAVPGYRKGHVPLRLVRQFYGEDVRSDVARKLVFGAYEEALRQSGAVPVCDPDFKDISLNEGQPLTFAAEVEVRPDITLPSYTGLALTKRVEAVSDEDVMKVLEDLRFKTAAVRDVAGGRGLAQGDIAILDFEGTVDGAPVPGGKGANYPLEIGSRSFIPGFEEELQGLLAGEEKAFDLTMPADYRPAELAGKTVRFAVKVTAAKERVLPAIDDEFARDVGDYADLAALKERVRGQLAAVREKEAHSALRQAAVERVVEGLEFDLPPSLLEIEEGTIAQSFVRRMTLLKIPVEEARAQLEASRPEIKKDAAARVRASLVLEEIARREGLAVDRHDLDRALAEMAQVYKKPVGELRREMISSGSMEGLQKVILEEKVLDFLVDKAQVSDAPQSGGTKA